MNPSASWLTAGLNGLNWHGQVCPPTLAIVTVPPRLCAPVPLLAVLLDELCPEPIALSPPPQAATSRPTAITAAAAPLMPLIVIAPYCSYFKVSASRRVASLWLSWARCWYEPVMPTPPHRERRRPPRLQAQAHR